MYLFLLVTPAFAQIDSSSIGEESHILQIFWASDPIIKLTLLILIGFSIVSWAIILYKHRELKRLKDSSARFHTIFWKAATLKDIAKRAAPPNPLFSIFRAGVSPFDNASGDNSPKFDTIRHSIHRATADEVEKIERYIPFLATTASASPFIGLFGTVWGILAAFWQIGQTGSSSLSVVGPHIAESLIATAAGLAAAIPAVIFYNFFVNRIRIFGRRIQEFADDCVIRIEKEYY